MSDGQEDKADRSGRRDPVGKLLRQEASFGDEAPAFSEPLHERVMAQVRRVRAADAAAAETRRPWWALPLISRTMAAALIAGLTLVVVTVAVVRRGSLDGGGLRGPGWQGTGEGIVATPDPGSLSGTPIDRPRNRPPGGWQRGGLTPDAASLASLAQPLEPIQATLGEGRFAYLDRDGKRLATFLLERLPGVVLEEAGSDQRGM